MKSKKAFTLIELLVVILIIGILAAVALPQYQKVVEKSKAAQALTLIKSVGLAAEEYYLANGAVFTNFDDLSLDIPWTGNEPWTAASNIRDTRSNGEWSLQLYRQDNDSSGTIFVGRISGKYKGGGFIMIVVPNHPQANTIYCAERVSMGGGVEFEEPAGSYCKQIMHGTKTPERVGNFAFDTYALP